MKIILAGCNGKMGKAVTQAVFENMEKYTIIAGIDPKPSQEYAKFPVFTDITEYNGQSDIIIAFTPHDKTGELLGYADKKNIPVVLGTTGHTPDETDMINSYSKTLPIFKSANMSVGVHLVAELAKKAAVLLKENFDIEIIEKHHNQKLDAPSGTALMIADGISSVFDEDQKPEYVFGRYGSEKKRDKNEIGIHALRGGSIIGEHEVIFAGQNELISISHSARSREMFASGALFAAGFLYGKAPGLYGMKDLLEKII